MTHKSEARAGLGNIDRSHLAPQDGVLALPAEKWHDQRLAPVAGILDSSALLELLTFERVKHHAERDDDDRLRPIPEVS